MSDFDMGGLAALIGNLPQRLAAAQQEAAALQATAEAGGGLVQVTVTGGMEVLAVRIDPAAAADVELLEDLVRAACNEAIAQAQEAGRAKIAAVTAGLPIPPGMIPGLG